METSSIYIFEAGSTKTDLLIYSNNQVVLKSLSGFNPNRNDTSFIKELSELSIPQNSKVFFYGSGISDESSIKYVKTLFDPTITIEINSDIIGAARACLKNKKGIVCILGTGAIVAYYDGVIITERKGGYGYLIDDTGGGFELSKLVVSHWLNKELNHVTNLAIEEHFNIERNQFISFFYTDKDLHQLANICKLLPNLAKQDKKLNHIINSYFDAFFKRHVLSLTTNNNITKINIVGSIGEYFSEFINSASMQNGIVISKTLRKPIEDLLDFHLNENR